MKVVVTGANGFIGRHCLAALNKAGYEVYAICHSMPDIKMLGVEYIQSDLFDLERVDSILKSVRAMYLLHLAWNVKPADYISSTANIRWLCASIQLLDSFIRHGGRRVVTAGTCAEYDWSIISETTGRIDEDFPKDEINTLYSSCKNALGNVFAAYMKKCNLSAAHGRIFYLFGPGENSDRLIPYAIRSFIRNKEVVLRNGMFIRDYLYVKDVADAFLRLLESDIAGAVNIGSGDGISLYDILGKVAVECGKTDKLIKNPQSDILTGDPIKIIADNEKLISIGWEKKYSIEMALSEYVSQMT